MKILIITTRYIYSAPRVLREIIFFSKENEVYCIGHTKNNSFNINAKIFEIYNFRNFIDILENQINKIFKLERHLKYRKIKTFIKRNNIHVIIIHEPELLEYGLKLKKKFGISLVFNAHEFYPLEFEENINWLKKKGKFYDSLYKKVLPKYDLIINVGEYISKKCKELYDLNSIIIPNCSNYYPEFEKTKNDTNKKVKLIHHGGINPTRKLEIMIQSLKGLENYFELDLMIDINLENSYHQYLIKLIKNQSNVKLIPLVPFEEIVSTIKNYDAGYYSIPGNSFNNLYCLPNKFFEFIQARLPIIIGPSPEMEKIIEKYKIGLVSKDFTERELRKTILLLKQNNSDFFQKNLNNAAIELSAENYYKIYIENINKLKSNVWHKRNS